MRTASFQRSLLAAVPILALVPAGCAWTFGERAKTSDPSVVPECSASRGGVFLDGVLSIAFGLSALAVLGESTEAAVPLSLLSVLHISSAVSGSSAASRCVDLRKAHTAWLEQERLQWAGGAAGQPVSSDEADRAALDAGTPDALPAAAALPVDRASAAAQIEPARPAGDATAAQIEPARPAGDATAAQIEPDRAPDPDEPDEPSTQHPAQPPAARQQPDEPTDEPEEGPWDDFWTEDQR